MTKQQIKPTVKEVTEEIKRIKGKNESYGVPRVLKSIKKKNPHWVIGVKRVTTIMRELGHLQTGFKFKLVNRRKDKTKETTQTKETTKETTQTTAQTKETTQTTAQTKETKQTDGTLTPSQLKPESTSHDPQSPNNQQQGDSNASQSKPTSQTSGTSLASLSGLPSLTATSPNTVPILNNGSSDDEDDWRLEIVEDDEEEDIPQCPSEFLCEMTGKVMTDPVLTPEGHHYERKIIEIWMKQAGSIDPLDGTVLLKKSLKSDEALKQRIHDFFHPKPKFPEPNFDEEPMIDMYEF